MLLLEQDTTSQQWVNKKIRQIEFGTGNNNKEYKIEAICDSVVYA